ncbi:hypothetical protein [Blastococcus tunisiensis]|uniref:hypothetical protein n=1 Tax=Blastococcus tunisiensis TaxID=1798228 RepID=UPI000B862AC7|nr:hypothetical protein [Blastococcus sp. DSM 46838]
MSDDRSAALVIRVWLEDDDRFRARLTAVDADGAGEDLTVAVASSPGDAVDALRQWLDEFVRHGTNTG